MCGESMGHSWGCRLCSGAPRGGGRLALHTYDSPAARTFTGSDPECKHSPRGNSGASAPTLLAQQQQQQQWRASCIAAAWAVLSGLQALLCTARAAVRASGADTGITASEAQDKVGEAQMKVD